MGRMKILKLVIPIILGLLSITLLCFYRTLSDPLETFVRIATSFVIGMALSKQNKKFIILFFLPFIAPYLTIFIKTGTNVKTDTLISWLNEFFFMIFPILIGYYVTKIKWYVTLLCIFLFSCISYYVIKIYMPKYQYLTYNFHINNGKQIKLDKLKFTLQNKQEINASVLLHNKIAVLDFSFFRCLQCKEKLSSLEALAYKYANDSSVFIGRIIDGSIESFEDYQKYCSENNGKLKILYDREGLITKQFKVTAYPIEFILDKNAKYWFYTLGYNGYDYYNKSYLTITSEKINSLR
jgi:hypothetical protein